MTRILVSVVLLQVVSSVIAGGCERGWIPYKDEKCFGYFQFSGSLEEGVSSCNDISPDAKLLTIKSKPEEDFVADLILNKWQISTAVWLGAKRSNYTTDFLWNDGTKMSYTNWVWGVPASGKNDLCVELSKTINLVTMEPREETTTQSNGVKISWEAVPCNGRRRTICEMPQTLSLVELTKIVLELQTANTELKKQNAEQNEKLSALLTVTSNLNNKSASLEKDLKTQASVTQTSINTLKNSISSSNQNIVKLQNQTHSLAISFLALRTEFVDFSTQSTNHSAVMLNISKLQTEVCAANADIVLIHTEMALTKTNIAQLQQSAVIQNSTSKSLVNDMSTTKASVSDLLTKYSAVNSAVSSFQKDIDSTNTSIDRMSTDISKSKTDILSLQKDVATQKSSISTLQTDQTSTKSSVSKLQTDLTSTRSSVAVLQTDMTSAKTSISRFTTDISKAKTDIVALQKDLVTQKSSTSALQTDVNNSKTSISKLQTDMTSTRSSVTVLQTDMVKSKTDRAALQRDVTSQKTSVSTLLTDVSSSKTSIAKLQTDTTSSKSSISTLQYDVRVLTSSQVPIGFIYTQLPSQSAPSAIWPSYTWQDVTSTYAGVFFRAYGGGSGTFGSTQTEFAPRLTNVQKIHGQNSAGSISITPGAWSNLLWSGDDGRTSMNYRMSLQFYVTSGEVRPRNMAVKIWKRTK